MFVFIKIIFAQALAITPHLSFGGLSGMVYEHLLGCFILKDPSLGFSKLFQVMAIVVRGDISRLVALMVVVNRLLIMAKDISGLPLIIMGKIYLIY